MSDTSAKSPPAWTNEKVLQFIELYRSHPIIWDTSRKERKRKNLAVDAWRAIEIDMGMIYTIEELKKKRESLMSTYRLCKKKVCDAARTNEDIFKPTWFAYEPMDSFLAPIYDKSDTVPMFTGTIELPNEDRVQENSNLSTGDTSSASTAGKRWRLDTEITEARATMKEAVNALKKVSNRSQTETSEVDEVSLFCRLLEKRLERFNDREREIVMHDINEVIYQRRNEFHFNVGSPGTGRTFVTSTPDTVQYTQSAPVANDYIDYKIVQPGHSEGTDPSSSSISTQRVAVISSDVVARAIALSKRQKMG